MIKLFLSLFFACAISGAFAQTKIDLADAAKHVGDSVTVEGKIYGVKILSGPTSPVLLNLGGDFPNQLLTIAVFPSYKSDKTVMPTEDNKGNVAKVTGKIEMYKGRPQIAVRSANQLSFTTAITGAQANQ